MTTATRLAGPHPLPGLPATVIRPRVDTALQRGADRGWSLADVPWASVRPDALTDLDRSIVRYITLIEDHLPGYLSWLLDAFPVTGPDLDAETFATHREYFRFFIAWAGDEERHAAALARYQIHAGMAQPDDLARDLAEEGRKPFSLPYDHPLQAFTYTLIQEKATQLFYQRFGAVTDEPGLRELLRYMARDEARHFAFYCHLVEAYLDQEGALAAPHLKEVLRTFRMPLADTLPDYWRRSLRIANATGYDHTEAYDAVARLVRDYTTSRGEAGFDDLTSFIADLRRLP